MSFFRPEIEAMQGYVPGEQPQTGKFIKLNTNENPYPPSARVATAITTVLDGGLAKYPDPFATAFRRRAAELLDVDPDWILCGNGSDDILTIITRALVGPGQTIRTPYPSYILYKTLAEIQGAQIEESKFQPDWTLSAGFARRTEELRLAIVPNPNSPSGTIIAPSELLRIADELPCPLLIDEAYGEFADQNCASLVAENPKIMVSRSMSKSYALAGIRFGYLIAQPAMIEQLCKVKDSYNCDALSIAGATAAIDDQQWLQQTRDKIIHTRQRLSAALRQLGFDVAASQANFVWCTHASRQVEPLYQKLKEHRVLVRYMNYPRWGDGLRITVGTDEQIDALLALLETL